MLMSAARDLEPNQASVCSVFCVSTLADLPGPETLFPLGTGMHGHEGYSCGLCKYEDGKI